MRLSLNLPIDRMQTDWASKIEPVLNSPIANPVILQSVTLTTGSNSVPHNLGSRLRGYAIIRQRSAASIYDTQDTNQFYDKFLNLTTSATVVVDILVF
jgi:hypothetical protein